MTVLALRSRGCRTNTPQPPAYLKEIPVVPFPVFLEPGEEPLVQPNAEEEPDMLFRLDAADTTQATPHL